MGEEVFLESAILDDHSAYKGGIGNGYPEEMVMEFYPKDEYGNNQSNWWAPTLKCLGAMLGSSGFKAVETWKLIDAPDQISVCRGFAHGSKL